VYLRQVEVIGGKSAVFTSELNESIESLFVGKNRAYSLAVMSVVLAGGYLLYRRASARAEASE
jgi:hypothetical protein